MSELDEFAEALMGQLSVEIDEEKVIAELAAKIKEDRNFAIDTPPVLFIDLDLMKRVRLFVMVQELLCLLIVLL